MNTGLPSDPQFLRQYHKHRKCLKLAGMQPKTVGSQIPCTKRGVFSQNLLTGVSENSVCMIVTTLVAEEEEE